MKKFMIKTWTSVKALSVSVWKYGLGHKVISAIALFAIIGGGLYAYSSINAGTARSQYVLSTVTQGPLNVTVTGSGQVSAQDTLSLAPQASAQIMSVNVTPGEKIKAGTIVAELDMTVPAQSVRTARENLTSAQISYQQSRNSAQTGTTNDQESITTAELNLNSAFTTSFANLPSIVTGLDGILHNNSTLTGYTAESNIDAYANYINTAEAVQYRNTADQTYATALASYNQTQTLYVASGSNPSVTQMEQLAQSLVQTTTSLTNASKAALTYYSYINTQMTNSKLTLPTQLSSQISSLTTYENTITSDTTSVSSDENALINAVQTSNNDTQSLNGGSTSLTLQAAQLNVQKAQDSLDQALQTEENYIVRAPFDGVIATVTGKKYDQGSPGTAIATLITTQEYASLSLNETDAAKVKVGQPATITFDALPNVTMQGTVAVVDGIGTVSQGVVTYTVQVGFNQQNPDIKPGMTANATITTASEASAIQVPSAAIKTQNGVSYVQVATIMNASSTPRAGVTHSLTVPASNVTLKRVPVTIGVSNDTMTEIISGLSLGQLVVTTTQSATTAKSSAASATSLIGGSGSRGATNGLGGGSFSGGGRTTGGASNGK
jgi:multidrug efflux pump subunit AcrA (membrane-fusion protein)